MGKLIYMLNVSADGFIQTPDGGLDWSTVDDEIHRWFNDRMRELDASLYGRRLYETMAGYWPTGEQDPESTETTREYARIWNRMPKIVFSSTLPSVDHNSRLVRGDPIGEFARLREEFAGDLDVGGATLASAFVRRGLVDEYRLIVHPVAIGGGTPFFPPGLDQPLQLRLTDTHTFTSGVHVLTYVPR